MLNLPSTVRVFVAIEPVDMRGSFDALAGRVRRLGLEPGDGHLYVFVSRRRHLLAILSFDGTGWVLVRKRLEAGTFQLPTAPANTSTPTPIHNQRRRDCCLMLSSGKFLSIFEKIIGCSSIRASRAVPANK